MLLGSHAVIYIYIYISFLSFFFILTRSQWVRIQLHMVLKKVVCGQEPPSGESTTTQCGFNYQLLAVITEVAQWGAPSCSQPQPATDNGVRDGRSN